MPPPFPETQPIAAQFAREAAGLNAREIAELVMSVIRTIEQVLIPILGKGGAVAMFRRCLFLVGELHPWVSGSDSARDSIDLLSLQAVFAARGDVEAADAGAVLLQTFFDLLDSLIGRPLGERLLRNVRTSVDTPMDRRP